MKKAPWCSIIKELQSVACPHVGVYAVNTLQSDNCKENDVSILNMKDLCNRQRVYETLCLTDVS